jgi:hypothetical protein
LAAPDCDGIVRHRLRELSMNDMSTACRNEIEATSELQHVRFKCLTEKGADAANRLFRLSHKIFVSYLEDLSSVGRRSIGKSEVDCVYPLESPTIVAAPVPIRVDERYRNIATIAY